MGVSSELRAEGKVQAVLELGCRMPAFMIPEDIGTITLERLSFPAVEETLSAGAVKVNGEPITHDYPETRAGYLLAHSRGL